MSDGSLVFTPLQMYSDKAAAEHAAKERNSSMQELMKWRLLSPNGQGGPSLSQFLMLQGIQAVGYDVVEGELQGALVIAEKKIVLSS